MDLSAENLSQLNSGNELQEARSYVNIAISNVLTMLAEQMDMIDMNKKYLKRHPNRIWQGKNGRWFTYLPDQAKGRRLVSKRTEEELYNEIIRCYKDAECREQIATLEEFYPQWFQYKSLHSNSSSYMRRLDDVWKKYYKGTEMVSIPLNRLTYLYLDEWAHKLVKEHMMSRKLYYNSTVIIRQALEYALELKLVDENPFSRVHVSKRLFVTEKKKPDKTQVFMVDEQPLLEEAAYKDFQETGSTTALGILLSFQLGTRVGETVALSFSDIDEEKKGYIHIHKQEIDVETKNADGTWHTTKAVVPYVKTEAGDRNIFLTSRAREIIEWIKERNTENGIPNDGYIFINEKSHERIKVRALDNRIRKCCEKAGIDKKSMHKVRKTFISTLIDSGVNINTIRAMVGHEDERTTYHNYCFDRRQDEQIQNELENALVPKRL